MPAIDEYCDKIFMVLTMQNENVRFNELHRILGKFGAKMSKPTLIQHLDHLIKNGIIERKEEGTQNVTYGLNWNQYKDLKDAKKLNDLTLREIKNKTAFMEKPLEQRIVYASAMITIGELYYLKLELLNLLEPEKITENTFSYTAIRRMYNMYLSWLVESCKDSKENTEKAIKGINKVLRELHAGFFDRDTSKGKTKSGNKLVDFEE